MRLDDLLGVMRDEFALAANDVDESLVAWLTGDPGQAGVHAEAGATQLDRLAQTARMIALDGLALALEQVRDSAQALAVLDAETMGEGLGWLLGWRDPFEACFAAPTDAQKADVLLQFLAAGPLAPPQEQLDELQQLLTVSPALPVDAQSELDAVADATAADVSLAVPDDVDPDLYETFLGDAPNQMARLGDAVRALARGELPAEQITEAQRVAHTFKGSGNIIGICGVGRLAHRIEDLMEFAAEQQGRLPQAMAGDLEQATATLDQMLFALRGEEQAPQDAQARLQALIDWVNAIRAGDWAERAAQRSLPSTAAAVPLAASPPAWQPAPPPETPEAPSAPDRAEAEAQLRVGVARMDRLMRRAGQGLVQAGRMSEHLRMMGDRLAALEANNAAMQIRLRELQVTLDRQGVALQEKVQAEGSSFDALEFDRYDHLHTLSRFIAELVADEHELTRAARQEADRSSAVLRQHEQGLKDQHSELLGARLVPFRNIVSRLRRTVSQTANLLGRKVRLDVHGEQVQLDSDVLERLTEPLLHVLRNAVDHGIEPADERALYGKPDEGTISLSCRRDGQTVRIECRDDGRGLDMPAVHAKACELGLLAAGEEPSADDLMQMILLPGFSTRGEVTEVSGRGVGMDVVADRVRAMKGRVGIASEPLAGTTFTLRVPATTGSTHALIVEAGGQRVALPTESVHMALAAGQGQRHGDRFHHQGLEHRLASLAQWIGLPETQQDAAARPTVLVRGADGTVAIEVDRVIDARALILQDLGTLLQRTRGVAGAALGPDGRVMFVLDTERLDLASRRPLAAQSAAALRRRATVQRQRVLVVDDAISVRKAVAQLVSDAGYEVLTARDGFDALQCLSDQRVDLVITDLEMPNLNGLEMTRQFRERTQGPATPVVMITSRATDKHRRAALDAGVNLYLTKPYTDDDLLGHLRRLLAA